jgi:hypothetical protein
MAKKQKKVTTTVTTVVTEEFIPTNEKTQIVCIADRSGSMASIIDDSIGGFNSFVKEQKKLKDEATLTLALFDDKYDLLYDDVDIQKVQEITKDVWMPRGMTALYDAIGKTITTVRANHAKLGHERPAKVLCVIITDGQENASEEYKDREKIKKLIKDCEEDNWNFMYLAANQDAFAVGTGFGVAAGNTYTYGATTQGVFNMSSTLTASAVSYRSMSSTDKDFKKKSKSLIDDDKDAPEDNLGGSITTNGTGNVVINGNTITTTGTCYNSSK